MLTFYYKHFFSEKDPVPVRCPVAGAFEFQQEGDMPFKTRVIKGITKNPRHDVWGRTGEDEINFVSKIDTFKHRSVFLS